MRSPEYAAAAVLALCLALLGGCATTPAPQSPREGLAYAEATFKAVEDTADAELPAMTDARATRVRKLLVEGRAILDEAETAVAANDNSTATSRLQTMASLLDQLQSILQAQANG